MHKAVSGVFCPPQSAPRSRVKLGRLMAHRIVLAVLQARTWAMSKHSTMRDVHGGLRGQGVSWRDPIGVPAL
jgi:hypothetical protein